KFDQAKTDDVKLSEAKNVLGLSGDQTEATINAAYTQKLNTFIELYQKESRAEGFSGEKVSIIKTRLKAARDFLLKEKTLSSFDFVSAGDFEPVPAVKPQLKLAIKLKLSKTLPEKLSADDVNNINEMYKKLNTEQQAVFVENINRLAKDSESSRPDMSDIITSAFADAEKSYSNSWKNMVVRWFKKITSSEDAYFDTVLEQAKDGDLDSKKLLTRREWFKNEAQKDLKTLTLSQKKDFLKEVQVKANKIAQKINLSFERSHEKTSQSTPAQNKLIGKQQTEAAKNFEKSCDDFLVKSFEPMLSKGEKILSVWDRKDHNLILNIVDFKSKAFDLNQPMLDQVDTLIKDQSLEMPQHRFTIPQFKTEIALKMIDFYLSPDNSNQNNDMQAAIEGASKNIENSGQIVDAIIKNVQDQCETLAATLIPEYKVEFNKKVAAIVTTRFNEFITRDPLALPK
ncbi:MAG: hypothetical protein NTZ68_03670, partial [Candidatus Dependentiae bacterium]|nr:hypothetical protein [Candidatus Dependentiae bacterium]